MAQKAGRYKGKQIKVLEVQGASHLFIDDEHIRAKARKPKGPYWSKHMPYLEFQTLHDLGRAIVDYRALDSGGAKSRRKAR